MLDNTRCFFIVEGSENCYGTIHVMFVVPILLVSVVVFECISSNIVKRDMALSSDEVRIVFFWLHIKLVLPIFQASISIYCAAKLPPLQPAPCYPKIF